MRQVRRRNRPRRPGPPSIRAAPTRRRIARRARRNPAQGPRGDRDDPPHLVAPLAAERAGELLDLPPGTRASAIASSATSPSSTPTAAGSAKNRSRSAGSMYNRASRPGLRLGPSPVSPPDRPRPLQLVEQLGQRRQVLVALQDDPADRGPHHGLVQHAPRPPAASGGRGCRPASRRASVRPRSGAAPPGPTAIGRAGGRGPARG